MSIKEIGDLKGDSAQLDKYLDASLKVFQEADAISKEGKAAGLKAAIKPATDALEAAQSKQADAQTAWDAAVKAGQKDPDVLKGLEKALNDAKEATKKATDAKVKAEKDYNDQLAKEEKAVVDAAEAAARVAAIKAKWQMMMLPLQKLHLVFQEKLLKKRLNVKILKLS